MDKRQRELYQMVKAMAPKGVSVEIKGNNGLLDVTLQHGEKSITLKLGFTPYSNQRGTKNNRSTISKALQSIGVSPCN